MINLSLSIVGAALICGLSTIASAQMLNPLYVQSDKITDPLDPLQHIVGSEHLKYPDASSIIGQLPGAAVVRNGPQTGIVQLRGLSGDRVGVLVDGMKITPACPNHMDPPLHYASLSNGSLVQMFAGISPVSNGGDHIGGSISISRPDPVFADEESSLLRGKLGASFLGNQDTRMLSTDLAYAKGDAAIEYQGSGARADNLRFPGGTVSDSGYETNRHEITGAWRTTNGFIALDTGVATTRDAGTPALPMDMIEDNSWNLGITQREKFDWGTLENRFYIHDIDHLMDNYSLRPVVGMMMQAPSISRDFGWHNGVVLPRGETTLRLGIDLHRNEFDAEQVAVASGFRRDTFNNNVRSEYGAYVDWEQEWTEKWTTRIGIRSDIVTSQAGAVSNQIMPIGMILTDQNTFNAADRSSSDVLLDAVAALSFKPDETTKVELAVAIKNRAPSLVERYLWTPSNASAGLADGRTYLGNLGLDPETAFEIALGLEKHGDIWNAKFTPFYQSINNYIQGEPLARLDTNGKPVLQYQNLDRAEIYGLELTGEYQITKEFSIDASTSYVRGRNMDTGDDLYRIAPLRGIVDLGYQKETWETRLECVWADAQNHVSTAQSESSSPGYYLLNLRLAKRLHDTLRVEFGIENLLNKRYADHLGGVNRVTGGDLASGDRIPGAGRFAYTSVSWEF